MFLDCFKNNGVPYLRICEGYRAKKHGLFEGTSNGRRNGRGRKNKVRSRDR